MLLQAAAPLIAAHRRDRGSVDGVGVLRSHIEWMVSRIKVKLVAEVAGARAGCVYL